MATSINYKPSLETDYTGPSWNNSNEYPSLTSNEFTYDQHQLDSLIERITELMARFPATTTAATAAAQPDVTEMQALTELEEQARILLGNMSTYANCLNAVDGSDTAASNMVAQLNDLSGKLEALTKPLFVYLMQAPENVLTQYFAHAHVKPLEFKIRYARERAATMLSETEEALLARLNSNGPMAFGSQYRQLSSVIRCNYEDPQTKAFRQIGLAEAAGLLRSSNENERRSAWRAIQTGWKQHETAVSTGLNALAGWRLEVDSQRARKAGRPVHFLDHALHSSRIKRETLEAMMTAVTEKREIGRRAVRAMAKAFGKSKLDPWDLLAPAPRTEPRTGHAALAKILAERMPGDIAVDANSNAHSTKDSRLTFEKGIGLISEAFDAVDPSFRDFVDTMKKNRWIEGRQLSNKRTGAFCTEFPKSNSPRVFQTYMGSLNDVRTLAHELGHAYHSWVMKDLPRPLTEVPMTLAETASLFAETAFADSLLEKAQRDGDSSRAFDIAWGNAESAAAFLLNIPARFEFEHRFYEEKQKGYVGSERLNELMNDAWTTWYGDTLTENEKQYWMTKLHFSLPMISFYNFPYTFGALFSLGIYAQRAELGAKFWPSYNALLRDTGRMTAEDLAQKHLGVDLTRPEFWQQSLNIIDTQVAQFEQLLAASAK